MPQLFKIVDEDLGTPSPEDPSAATMETPSALGRLQSMLGPKAVSVVEDAPAVDADANDAGGVPDDDSFAAGDGTVAPSPTSEEGADDMHRVAVSEPPESSAAVVSDAVAGALPDALAIPTDSVPIAQTTHRRDAVAAFRLMVHQAQEVAETQLQAVIGVVRNETSERHAADLARVAEDAERRAEQAVLGARAAAEADGARLREESDRRHAQELRHAQDNVRAEMTAAAEQARNEESVRHAAELMCRRDELEQLHAEELQRVCAVALDSFEVLTERIVHTA